MQLPTTAYITAHDYKFLEAQEIIPSLVQVKLPYSEQWSYDIHDVVAHKLKYSKKQYQKGPFIVEDTALYLNALNDFPGALIHWLNKIGYEEMYKLVQKTGNYDARAVTLIGYYDGELDHFFIGEITGKIVAPKGNEGFGWDAIFQPDGIDETYAEMGSEFKPEFSMRTQAFIKLRDHLEYGNT